jgi:hypothetical protein
MLPTIQRHDYEGGPSSFLAFKEFTCISSMMVFQEEIEKEMKEVLSEMKTDLTPEEHHKYREELARELTSGTNWGHRAVYACAHSYSGVTGEA